MAGLAGCSSLPSTLSLLPEDCEVDLRCPREISFQDMYNQSYSEQGGFVGGSRGLGLNPVLSLLAVATWSTWLCPTELSHLLSKWRC